MPDASIYTDPSPTPHIPPDQRFNNPVGFVYHDLKTKLWSKQAEILRAVKQNKRTAVRSCNGSGKTFVAATAVIWWLMAHADSSAMVVTTAPTQHQVRDLLWREIRNLYYRNAALIGGTIGRTTLELSPRHFATGLSTDSPERFQGFHETNILFVVDEASGVREEVYEAIEGSMTSRRVRLLLIGNPTSLTGTFYKAFHQRRAQYKTIHISAFDTPNLWATAQNKLPLLREGAGGRVDCSSRPSRPTTPGAKRDNTRASGTPPEIPLAKPAGDGPSREVNPELDQVADPSLPPRCDDASQKLNFGHPNVANSVIRRKKMWHARAVPGIVTPEWVDEAALTWGNNSAQYQVRVLGEFPTQANDTLIPLTQIEAALSSQPGPAPAHRAVSQQNSTPSNDAARPSSLLREGARGRVDCDAVPSAASARPDLTAPISIGVDVARFGTDRTVICVRQGNHVIVLDQHQKLDTMRTTGLVVKAINDFNPKHVRIDEIGIGAGVVDRLHELNYTQVEGINVGNRATDPEHFFNLRSELYDNLRARFEEQTIVIPNDDDLIGQLAAIRVEYTSRGQLKVEPKETMRRRSLPSPDKADALLLAFAPTPQRSGFQIWTGAEEF